MTSPQRKPRRCGQLAMWTTEPTTLCSFLSGGWYEITGQREGAGLGFGWADAVHRDDRERAMDEFMRANEQPRPFAIEYRLRRENGDFVPITSSGAPRFDQQGGFLGFVGSVTRSAPPNDDDRIASEPLLQALFAQRAAGVAILWRGGHFARVNDQYCIIVGRRREKLAAVRMQDIIHPADRPRNAALHARLIADGASFETDKRYVRPDGSAVWVHGVAFAMTQGRSHYVVVIDIDISERSRIEWERYLRGSLDEPDAWSDRGDMVASLFSDWLTARRRGDG